MNYAIQKLSSPSLFRWLSYAIGDWLLIGLTLGMALHFQNIFVYWLATLIIGNRQHAIAFLGHDGAHRTISKNRYINDMTTCFFAFWPLGVGLSGYRRFHFKHHRHVGTLSDPELTHKKWASPEYDLPFSRKKMLFFIARDLIGFGARDVFRLARSARPANLMDILGPMSMTGAFLYFSLHFKHPEIFGLWYFSMFTSFWATFRLRIWVEHIGTRKTLRVRLKKWQEFLFAPYGAAFHYEHHRWPSVPCWNLKMARRTDLIVPILEFSELIKFFETSLPLASGDLPNFNSDERHRQMPPMELIRYEEARMNQGKNKFKILFAEDDVCLHMVVSEALGNYHLIIVDKAITAIEIINNFGQDIDGIVCDFNFRDESLTGHDVYKAMKIKYPRIPFFLFSSDTRDLQELFKTPSDFTLDKFDGIKKLKATLDGYFLKH